MISYRIRAVVVLAAMTLCLSGCVPAAPQGSPSGHGTSTPPSTSSAPALSSLVLGPDGIGDARLGRPVPASTRIARFDPTACASSTTGIKAGDADAGAWAVNYPDLPDTNSDTGPSDVPPFDLVVNPQSSAGTLAVVWIWSPAIRTSTGIHVGSSVSAVIAAYPRPSDIQRGDYSDVYVTHGSLGDLHIEVAHAPPASSDLGDDYWGARNNTVLWMSSSGAGTSYGPVAGTDELPQPCLTVDNQ